MQKLILIALVVLFLIPVFGRAEAGPGPDLLIASVSVEANPTNPNRVRVEITVGNLGDAPAGAFTIRWYPLQAMDEIGCSIEVPGLGAHKRGTARCFYTYVGTGEMHWRAVVDVENEIAEDNENNNEQSGTIVIGGSQQPGNMPDLTIQNAHFEPAEVVQGQEFRAVMTVVNRGGVDIAEPFHPQWRFHPELGLEDCVWVFGRGLGAGVSNEASCERTTNARPGEFPTRITVDTDNVIREGDEANNDASVTLTVVGPEITPAVGKPDLLIEDAYFEPARPVPDELFQASVVVLNNGSVPVTEPYSVVWRFHPALGLQDCTWEFDETLRPGLRARMTCSQVIFAPPGGQAPTIITADAEDTVDEADETNNDMSVTLVLAGEGRPDTEGVPDLIVRNLSVWPNPVNSGQDLLIEYEVVNQGRGTAPASVARWTTPSGAGVSVRCTVPALEVGQSFRCTQQIPAPSRKGGTGNSAKADVDNVVDEGTGEDNNVLRGEALTVQ